MLKVIMQRGARQGMEIPILNDADFPKYQLNERSKAEVRIKCVKGTQGQKG